MSKNFRRVASALVVIVSFGVRDIHAQTPAAPAAAAPAPVVFPMDRTAYFVGEQVPLAINGTADVKLEAVNADGRTTLYAGKPASLLLDTSRLAPGDYALELNGARAVDRFTLTSPLRRSAASMQDEATPGVSSDETARVFNESGLTGCFAMASSDAGRSGILDWMARTGALLMINSDTRPTSFFPVGNNPIELDGVSQRMILTAQANSRYPNFGGFCYGWDAAGYAVGARRGLIVYWGWQGQTQALRNYIDRADQQKMDEFTRRTGLKPVTEPEYLAYLLSIKRPEFAPAIDLPTKVWLEEIGQHTQPLTDAQRVEFERRLDAWSAYLMGLYNECYSTYSKNLAAVDPSIRNTASVQIDHAPTRSGQYFPSAYAPLDFRYQSTWNDQIDGPDYAYQWLLTSGLLEIGRGDKPVWLSNSICTVSDRSNIPGKFLKVAAHDLAWGGSGIGFAAEGFSNLLGGMNKGSNWDQIKGKAGECDVRAGREFLDRFASLATQAHGDFGVGVLFSKSQYGRQHIYMTGFAPPIQAFLALVKMGYTPRLVTEEELAAGGATQLKALVVIGQEFPMPEKVMDSLAGFVKNGGRIIVDGNTTLALPGAEKLGFSYPRSQPGRTHNWTSPNFIGNENAEILFARHYAEVSPAYEKILGETGRGIFRAENGVKSDVALTQIAGGADAKYVIAINDSYVSNQADWYQVKEQLKPTGEGWLYDCTEEKSLGKLAPLTCDLTQTTARVFAVLPRELQSVSLAASQSVAAGQGVGLRVEFQDSAQKRLAAVLPFHITLNRPDGKVQQTYYRATTPEGTFAIILPIPANAPAGQWSVTVRSQLNGATATLPITIAAPANAAFASAISDSVIVRNRDAAEAMLAKGAKVVLPLFDAKQQPVADRVKAVLEQRGVTVDIWQNPTISTYLLAYEPTADQLKENARIDSGAAIGKIARTTVNANDWYSAMSGYRFGGSLILLDLTTTKGDQPMAEAIDSAGVLWPQVSAAFPGNGHAIVQAVPWAFGPRTTTLVIQAADETGLLAGAESLAKLPEDRITPSLVAAKAALWREYHIGGQPEQNASGELTAKGIKTGQAPEPFALKFVGNEKPLPADQVKHPGPVVHASTPIPATFTPTQCVTYYRDGDKYIETVNVGMLMPDLRFSQALMLPVEAKQAGKVDINVHGVFRYSDREPCSQPQWEEILSLRAKLVPKERKPVEMLVQIDGKPAGKLVAAKTEQKDVPLESKPMTGEKPKTANEEAVTQIHGTVELPAGKHEILLIEQNIVDGKLEKISVGQTSP